MNIHKKLCSYTFILVVGKVVAIASCTMDNPAFREPTAGVSATDSGASSATSEPTVDPTTQGPTTGDTASSSATPTVDPTSTSEPTEDPSDATTTTTGPDSDSVSEAGPDSETMTTTEGDSAGAVCDPFVPPNFDFTVYNGDVELVSDCGSELVGYAQVHSYAADTETIKLVKCDGELQCLTEICEGESINIDLDYPMLEEAEFAPHVTPGACAGFAFGLRRPTGGGCKAGSVTLTASPSVENLDSPEPLVYAAVNGLTSYTRAFDFELELLAECACFAACCDDLPAPPGTSLLRFSGGSLKAQVITLGPGMSEMVMIDEGMGAMKNYASAMDADCDADPYFAWVVSREPIP